MADQAQSAPFQVATQLGDARIIAKQFPALIGHIEETTSNDIEYPLAPQYEDDWAGLEKDDWLRTNEGDWADADGKNVFIRDVDDADDLDEYFAAFSLIDTEFVPTYDEPALKPKSLKRRKGVQPTTSPETTSQEAEVAEIPTSVRKSLRRSLSADQNPSCTSPTVPERRSSPVIEAAQNVRTVNYKNNDDNVVVFRIFHERLTFQIAAEPPEEDYVQETAVDISEEENYVQEIVAIGWDKKKGRPVWHVQWEGFGEADMTWEPYDHIKHLEAYDESDAQEVIAHWRRRGRR